MNNILEAIVSSLRENGFAIVRQSLDFAKLDAVKYDFFDLMNEPPKLKVNDEHFAVVYEPYLNAPITLELTLHPPILDIARLYLGRDVFLGTCNLRKSKVTSAPPISTNLFHMDENCGKGVNIMKAFFYLNDVDIDGGPFEYIRGSHKNKVSGWQNKLRWSDNEIYDYYGVENAIKLTANYGDLVLADTTGFHRGLQVQDKPRHMFTANYVPNMEKDGQCLVAQSTINEYPLYKNLFKFAKVLNV